MSRLNRNPKAFRRAAIVAATATASTAALIAPAEVVPTHAAATATVTLAQGVEHAGRMINLIHSDGSFAYGVAQDDATYTLVSLDPGGQIVREEPAPEAVWHESGSHTVDGRTFVRAMSIDSVCSLYPFDPAGVALGDPTTVSTGSCGGQFVSDPAIPSVLWFPDGSIGSITAFDTSTAAASAIPLPTEIPEHYRLASVFVVAGDVVYVGFRADWDPATGEEFTAADGSELPPLMGRFDRAAGTLLTAPGGVFTGSLPDGSLFSLVDGEAQLVDPVTLALSPIGHAVDPFPPQPLVGDTTAWTAEIESDSGALVVAAHDPTTLAEVGRASASINFAPDTYTILTSSLIGDTLMVSVANESWDDATQTSTRASVVFTATV